MGVVGAQGCGEIGVVVWYLVAISVKRVVAWAQAAVPKARAFKDGPEVVGPVSALPVSILGDFRDAVDVWLSVCGIVVAVPHNVVGVGALSFAVWVVAKVALVYPSRFEAIWSANTPSDYRF